MSCGAPPSCCEWLVPLGTGPSALMDNPALLECFRQLRNYVDLLKTSLCLIILTPTFKSIFVASGVRDVLG